MVANPEFLKEGAAVEDFMRPDRIVIGADDPDAVTAMRELYAPFQRNHERLQVMDIRSAELTKYAANAMLATRISFMNELALLAEKLGADIEHVRVGIGSDPRIGYSFLYPGVGFGGSCFPKDVRALLHTGEENGVELQVIRAVQNANERQKQVLAAKIRRRFGDGLRGKRFALWGLSFKPNTDDMREAPSLVLVDFLLDEGAHVVAYDPVAMEEARAIYKGRAGIEFAVSAEAAVKGADALVIVTEWKAFRSPDFDELKASLKSPIVFDGRNIYEPSVVRSHGLEYHGIGRGGAPSGTA
jgi:UDPglucose 6-dehydrogenase